ncbi:superoxide dismutase [Actinomadura roseirufa]|uniref:superoxide dismutase n=1 Tax=Actinomadura roseirufa TaxID=2094049 RepID=UPI0010416117|nr:superoxide dismutase [Actinomadura roseirufa]
MRRRKLLAALGIGIGLAAVTGVPAHADAVHPAASRADPEGFPTTIPLPNGFRPEGITIGPGPVAYFGSLKDGAIYRADLRTGKGAILGPGPGKSSTGLKNDGHGRLFVAGGSSGDVRVVDDENGKVLASYHPPTGPALVNDVILSGGAAWYTDSTNPALYKLPLHGKLPDAAEKVPLTGDIVYGAGINANGITPTPDGEGLIVIQSNTGSLFRVERNGVTHRVDLHGESLPAGDGLLLRGRTLFAVQNRLNTVAVLRLNEEGTDAHLVRRLTDARFDVPTTVAAFGSRLYLPNARFNTTPTPDTPYNAISVPSRPESSR